MDRIEKLRAAMLGRGLDGLLLTSEPCRHYATMFAASDGAAVITAKGAYFFTDSRYIEAAGQTIKGYAIAMTDINNTYISRINEVIEKDGVKKLGFEDGTMTYRDYADFSEKLHAQLVPAQDTVNGLREVKEQWEIDKLIAAQRLAEKAFDQLLGVINPEMTEKQVAAELIYRMRLLGADDVSFDPIIVSGANSSKPHGVPGNDRICRNTFTTIDFGVKLDGFCSDETRTIAFGSVSDEMRRVYDIVLEAQLAGIAAARAGVTGAEIDGAAREVIKKAGYGEYFGHGFGHGVGLEIHEAPTASPSGKKPLKAGAVISAEPGIYLPGRFGVRIEDVIILHEGGCTDITLTDKSLLIL